MSHNNSNTLNPTAKKEKPKPSNITISTGSQVFLTLGSYQHINSGLQTATANNNNADNSLHYIDTKKKTPTNIAQGQNNYFLNQKKVRAVSGSNSNNPNIKNIFNSKMQVDIQSKLQSQQKKRLFSPNNMHINNGPSDNNIISNVHGVTSTTKQPSSKVHDALNISNHSIGNRYVSSGKQYNSNTATQGQAVIKIQKQGQLVEKNPNANKIQKSLKKQSIKYNQGQIYILNTQQAMNDNQISLPANQNYPNLNESALGHFAAQEKKQNNERAQMLTNHPIQRQPLPMNQKILITEEYSTHKDDNDGKPNTSGLLNQSFQFGIGPNLTTQIYHGGPQQNRAGSNGSTNKTKSRLRSGSNKINLIQKNHNSKSSNPRKKITINTNPAQILMEQQNLNRGVLTAKTTIEGKTLNFKNLHSNKSNIKPITPGAGKNNLTKKGLIIQTSSNLPTKKPQTKNLTDQTQIRTKSLKEKSHTKNCGGDANQNRPGPNFKLQNNNIFQGDLNYIKEQKPLTTKNITQNQKDQSQLMMNGKKFNLDNAIMLASKELSDNQKNTKGHSNIMGMFKKQQLNGQQIQDPKRNQRQVQETQSHQNKYNSQPRSNDGTSTAYQVNTSFNGPYTGKNMDGEIQILKNVQGTSQLYSNQLSQKKYKTIADDFQDGNVKEMNGQTKPREKKVQVSKQVMVNKAHMQQIGSYKGNQMLNQNNQPTMLNQKQINKQLVNTRGLKNQSEEYKKKLMNNSAHDSRNLSQKTGQQPNNSNYEQHSMEEQNNIILKFTGKNKGQTIKSSQMHHCNKVKSAERTNSIHLNNNIVMFQEEPAHQEIKVYPSKSQQPSNKVIEKLKIGYHQLTQFNDTAGILPQTTKNGVKVNLKIKPAEYAQNVSCENADIKSIGSTKSKVSKTAKNQYHVNNNFQNLSKFKKNNQNLSHKSSSLHTKSSNKWKIDQRDKDGSLSPQMGQIKNMYNLLPNGKVHTQTVTQQVSMKQMSIGARNPPKTMTKQTSQQKKNVNNSKKINQIVSKITTMPLGEMNSREVLSDNRQFSLLSAGSSIDSMQYKMKGDKLQKIQKSVPDLNFVNQQENFTYEQNQEEEGIKDYIIPTIQKGLPMKQKKPSQNKRIPKIKHDSKHSQYYEDELKKRDDLVQMLFHKIHGMESQINLLTQSKENGSSVNDIKEQKNNMSPMNASKQFSINTLDNSNDFMKMIKDLIKNGQMTQNDLSDLSIQKLPDASMSSQQTALLLRCMQRQSKQSKTKPDSFSMGEKQFENILDQVSDNDGQLQMIMSMVNCNSEEGTDLDFNNEISKNLISGTFQKKNQMVTEDFRHHNGTLGQEPVLSEIINSFDVQKGQNEFLNQAFADIPPVEIETANDQNTEQKQNKFMMIEQGISTLQNKLNDFNNFNKNPKRIAELRRYCATSITQTTKTISEGMTSRLMKSGSNSGLESKNKTTTRHYQSTSNLDQNSLITVAHGEFIPNGNGPQIVDLFMASSESNTNQQTDQKDSSLNQNTQSSPQQLDLKVNNLKMPNLHLNNLSNNVQKANQQSREVIEVHVKTEDDADIKELEGLMNKYSMLEKEWDKNDDQDNHKIVEPNLQKSHQKQTLYSQPSDIKPKVKFNQTQKLQLKNNFIQNPFNSAQFKSPLSINQSKNNGNEAMKISFKQENCNLDKSKVKKEETGGASFLSWNMNQDENVFYKTQNESTQIKPKLSVGSKKQNTSNEEYSVDNIAIDQNMFAKSIANPIQKMKTQKFGIEQKNVITNPNPPVAPLNLSHSNKTSTKTSAELKPKIKLVGKKTNQNTEKSVKRNVLTNKDPQIQQNFFYKQPAEPREQIQQLIQHQVTQKEHVKKPVQKIAKIKMMGDQRNGIQRNNYVVQQKSLSFEEEKIISDQNVHSMERQLQRLNELEDRECVLLSNEISIIEKNPQVQEAITINETSIESSNQEQTNQSIRCLQGQGQVNTNRNSRYEYIQPAQPATKSNKERLEQHLANLQRSNANHQ